MAYPLNNIVTQASVNNVKKILRCWQPGVSKFTPGSFYNFEQDNLPLYDLEERTYFNWQRLGFPDNNTGTLPPIHLLVSADAPAELVSCDSNIFHTLPEAINALPKYINQFTRISVASFGSLGEVDIEGFNIDPKSGALEIVNINSFDKPGTFPFAIDDTATSYLYDARVTSVVTDNNNQVYGIYKNFICESSAGASFDGFCGISNFFLRAPGPGLGSLEMSFGPYVDNFEGAGFLFSSIANFTATSMTLDARTTTAYTAFVTPIPGLGSQAAIPSEICRLSVGSVSLVNPTPDEYIPQIEGQLTLLEEDSNSDIVTEIYTYDPSSFNPSNSQQSIRTAQSNLFNPANDNEARAIKSTIYGNHITRLKISNCQGRLFVRGFHCKGSGRAGPKIGIEVSDTNNLFLESMAISRYGGFGLHLTNSTVKISRSFYVYRCYGYGSEDLPIREDYLLRLSKPWQDNIKSLHAPTNDDSAGVAAYNSEIIFDGADGVAYAKYNYFLNIANFPVNNVPTNELLYKPGFSDCRMISRCSTGIKLVNSVISGGRGKNAQEHSTAESLLLQDFIHVEGNANYGLDLENSRVSLTSNLQVFHNTRGIRSRNSTLNLESFKIDNNHLYGLSLENSNLNYGLQQVSAIPAGVFDFSLPSNPIYDTTNLKRYQFVFDRNGQHILANNSNIKLGSYKDPKISYFGRFILGEAFGVDANGNLLPSVSLENTKADLIHLTSLRSGIDNKKAIGAQFYINNNSEATFLGSASSLTCIAFPPGTNPSYPSAKKYVGIVVKNNSTARFRGPTVIYEGAVNVLAQNNSNIVFEPHKKADGTLDINGFSLDDPKNHTMVEVKSIRSCLVADKGSNIIMEDLGAYTQNWPVENLTDATYPYSEEEQYTSAGFFQFYPNPNLDVYSDDPYLTAIRRNGQQSGHRMASAGDNRYYWGLDYTSDPFDLSAITNGGVCLRALNNSNIRVRNVNFPCGWWNASSVIYDINDTANQGYCGKTFIWNISNNSTLHADYVSVSGLYPAQAGYHGPDALWLSGAGAANYGAPSSTPDTSSLSVLDAFGSGLADVWPLPDGTMADYGFESPQNQGPFRLYVGVDSMATQLQQDGELGYIPQLFAQGYNASGDLSSVDGASSVYGKILRISEDDGTLGVSGYYYCNEFVKIDPNSIMLDESAANAFANAKNGAMGTSNRPQICTIYNNTTMDSGEAPILGTLKGAGFMSSNVFDILEEN